jgi:dihydrofolate reductase
MKFITEHNYKKVCLLGGTQIYSYFLERNLIDEISLTIEPLVFGEGLPLFSCAIEPHRFALVSTKKLNNKGSLVLHYKRVE